MERWSEVPVLIGQEGPLQGGRWPLARTGLLIGRGADCDVMVADRQVSRHHARIRMAGEGEFVLEDLGSKNGTHVNGAVIEGAHRLVDGDVIQVAVAAKLLFVGTEATLPLTLEAGLGTGRLRIDSHAHRVWLGESELEPPLSPPQYHLLELLLARSGEVVGREEVIQAVWPGSDSEGISEQAIDALVRRLRERLAEADPEHAYIVTVRGHGFRLENAAGEPDRSAAGE